MTAYPGKGGEILTYDVETALGTGAGSASAIRTEEGFDFPTSDRMLAAPSHMGKAHWADTSDSPVTFESYMESAVKVPAYVRGFATVGTKPWLVKALESGGLSTVTTTVVNLDAYSSSVSFSADGTGNASPGDGMALQVDDGFHWPFLVANQPAAATYNFVPGYAVPGSIATPASNDIYGAYTLTPRARQVPTTATLTFDHYVRQAYTGGSNQMRFTAKGCALAGVPSLSLEPGKPIKFDLAFHCADLAISDSAYTSADDTCEEQEQFCVWGGAGSQFAFGDSSLTGAISAGSYNLISASVDFAHKVIPIIGTGTTGTLNNCQGYMSVPGAAIITLNLLCDTTFWTDISGDTFQEKYIHFAQAGTLTKPFFGAFFPRCQQTAEPEMTDKRGDYMQVKLTYTASAANWNSVDTVDTDDSAPWALVLGRGGAPA